MNRTQKKCLIASVGVHGLLIALLFIGPAFMSDRPAKTPTFITMIPLNGVISDARTSIAGPAVQAPQSAPVLPPQPQQPIPIPPQPQRVTVPRSQPQPKPEPLPVEKRGDEFKPTKSKPAETADEFKPVSGSTPKKQTKVKPKEDAQDTQVADRMMRQFQSGISTLKSNLKPGTVVQVGTGGDSGEATINYSDLVYSKYFAAWVPPASLTDESATVMVRVTISRDGRVVRHDIVTSSGNSIMDRSIETTLNNVDFIAAFPVGSKDLERSYVIKFNISAKKAL